MSSYKDILLLKNKSIKDAMELLDKAGLQLVIVHDENNKLYGSVTDGDIRRAILRGLSLDSPIGDVANTNPVVATKGAPHKEKASLLGIPHIIIVDESNHVIGIDSVVLETDKENHVVLMAGGVGSRLHPLTKEKPKPMLAVGQKPILETIVTNFSNYGFKKFTISVNYKSDMIKDYFQDGAALGVEIDYIEEKKPLGTAGALSLLAPKRFTEPFFVMNGDILTNVNFDNLLSYHNSNTAAATMAVRKYEVQIPYATVESKDGMLQTIVEKPINNYFVNAGIYTLSPDILTAVPKDEFFDMPDLLQQLMDKQKNVFTFPIHEYWLDIGRLEEYKRANDEYRDIFL